MAGTVKKKIIFGLGTGRCGTMSLANLLNLQENSVFTHELGGLPWLPWKKDNGRFEAFSSRIVNRNSDFVGDVSFYSLPYWREIESLGFETKFIILKRNKKDTVKSYMNKTNGENPFMDHDGTIWRHYEWDKCYPKMKACFKEEAVALYYDYYYDLCEQIPQDKCFWINTEDLNQEDNCKQVLKWCGFKNPKFIIFKKNESKDVR